MYCFQRIVVLLSKNIVVLLSKNIVVLLSMNIVVLLSKNIVVLLSKNIVVLLSKNSCTAFFTFFWQKQIHSSTLSAVLLSMSFLKRTVAREFF